MPATNNLRVNTRLTTVSVEFTGGAGFVADEVAPILPVPKQAGLILEHDLANLQSDPSGDDRIGQGEEPPIIKGDLSERTYSTRERARGATVHDDEVDADNAEEAPYEVKVQATELAAMRLLRNREVRVKAAALAAATGATPGTKWDAANSDPIADVMTQKIAMYDAVGLQPNHLVIPWVVVERLKNNAAVKAFFTGGSTVGNPAVLTVDALRALFGIPNIHVADAASVAGNMVAGAKTGASLTSIWGSDLLMYYRPDRPQRREIAFMYTYVWNRAFKGAARNARGQVVTEHYDPRKRTLFIDARTYSDEQTLVATCGRKLTSVLT